MLHHIEGDISSIEELMENIGWDIAQDNCNPADIVLSNMCHQELVEAIQAIDPNGLYIAEMLSDGKSVREIADSLNIPKSTYSDRIARLLQKLCLLGF